MSVLPPLALPLPENSTLAVRPLLPAFERNIVLVRRKNRSLSPVAHTVWDLIHRVVRERNKSFALAMDRQSAASTTAVN